DAPHLAGAPANPVALVAQQLVDERVLALAHPDERGAERDAHVRGPAQDAFEVGGVLELEPDLADLQLAGLQLHRDEESASISFGEDEGVGEAPVEGRAPLEVGAIDANATALGHVERHEAAVLSDGGRAAAPLVAQRVRYRRVHAPPAALRSSSTD